MADKIAALRRTALFGGLDDDPLGALAERAVERRLARGEVLFNEEPVGKSDDRILQSLRAMLMRVKANCDAAKTPCQVTIASEARSKHGRTMEVADACAEAGITSLSFNVTEEE